MPAAINIPASEFPTLIRIVKFSDAEFAGLVKALRESAQTLNLKKYGAALSKVFPNYSEEEAIGFIGTLFALYSIAEKSKLSAQDLAQSIGVAASESRQHGSSFSGENTIILKNRLSELLSLRNSFSLTLKALDVLSEVDHVFCSSRILSDIRPVFADSLETASAAVITHNLQIAFHHLGKHEEFYVTLQEGELQQLKETIERAQKKNTTLGYIIKKSELKHLSD